MLYAALELLLLTGYYPLWRAWRANRGTTLRHAIVWAAAAWTASLFLGLGAYLALALTACACVAVLGARRPIVAAWNFVVASLLVVLLLPIAEGLMSLRLNGFAATLLCAALGVGTVNYLPTRTAAAVLPAAAACAAEMGVVLKWLDPVWNLYALALLAVAPWLGLAVMRRRARVNNEIDREWLDFRDRFGAVWALPAVEQFNRASANAGWGVVLGWSGTLPSGAAARRAEALTGLRAVLKRFRTEEEAAT